ncbi:MAG: SgcJ/EcaC family oxidoreductase [Ginsengibacter sp.]|jgi:uncharacterized protein (TIGR02246 family)
MKKIVLATFALTFGVVLNSRAQNHDEIAIKKVVTKFETIFNQKDAKETARFWAEDGDYITYLGELLHGRDEIEKYFQATFTRYYQTAHDKLFEPTIRFLEPDIAAVDVKWEVSGATSSDGKPKLAFKGIMVWTMTKENGEWLIKIMHNVTLPN